ncbi:MAG: TolC family outer membrane protein [Acidiferrobacteraceae bacterium]
MAKSRRVGARDHRLGSARCGGDRDTRARMPSRRPGVILTAVLLASGAARAEDLLTAYHQALRSSPLIVEAKAELRAARAGEPLARAALLPHVNAGASAGLNDATISGGLFPKMSGPYHSNSYSVTLTQPLFDGAAFSALHAADRRVQAAQAALAYSEQSLALQVTKAYFAALQAKADERVARDEAHLLDQVYQQARTALKVGTGDLVTVDEARARADAAHSRVVNALDAARIARRTLARITQAPVGTLSDVGALSPRGPVPDRVAPWVSMALRNQPLLMEAKARLRAAEDQVDVARRAGWPQVSLSGVAEHSLGTLFPGMEMNQVGASVNLTVPLYEGGAVDASVQRAEAEAQARRAGLTDLSQGIRLRTETAFLALTDSVEELKAAAAARKSARTSLIATRRGYELGARSVLDLLTSATGAARAGRDYYRALYRQIVARVRLKAAAGVLTEADISAINALLHAPAPDHAPSSESGSASTPR